MPSDAQPAGLAQTLGVDGVLLVGDASTSTNRKETREDRTVGSAETKSLQMCPQHKHQGPQVKRTLTEGPAAARVRLVRATDAQVIFADTVGGQASRRRCSDQDQVAQADAAQLMNRAVSDARVNLLRMIALGYEQRPLDLMLANKYGPGAMRKDFDAAVRFAQGNCTDKACRRFDDLYLDNKESVALSFNAALCHEVRGQTQWTSQGYRPARNCQTRRARRTSAACRRPRRPSAGGQRPSCRQPTGQPRPPRRRRQWQATAVGWRW